MADYIELTDAETAFKKPIRQALMRKIKDNFVNHEARIKGFEESTIMFDHFTSSDIEGRSFPTGDVYLEGGQRDWTDIAHAPAHFVYYGRNATGTPTPRRGNHIKPHWSVARWGHGAGSVPWQFSAQVGTLARCFATKQFQFDGVVKPIVFDGQFRFSNANLNIMFGLVSSYAIKSGTMNGDGVYLVRVDASNWRFVSEFSGSRTNGTQFGVPAGSTWFRVRIEFTDDPVDKALTFVDVGSGLIQIDDFQSDLPKTVPIHWETAADFYNPISACMVDTDWALFSSGTIADQVI